MVWEGAGIIDVGRALLGVTDPKVAAPGTIRGDFAIEKGRNICHGSDSRASAAREIAYWFNADEISNYSSSSAAWVYEK